MSNNTFLSLPPFFPNGWWELEACYDDVIHNVRRADFHLCVPVYNAWWACHFFVVVLLLLSFHLSLCQLELMLNFYHTYIMYISQYLTKNSTKWAVVASIVSLAHTPWLGWSHWCTNAENSSIAQMQITHLPQWQLQPLRSNSCGKPHAKKLGKRHMTPLLCSIDCTTHR